MKRHAINWPKLRVDLDFVCRVEKISLREVSRQTGIPTSGLTKLRRGGKLSADATAALIAWLNPGGFCAWIAPVPSPSLPKEGEDSV